MVGFQALGGVRASADGRDLNVGGPQQRRLLAMLLIHRNTVVSTDRLIDTVFAGEPTPAAAATLRSYIARMRRVIDSSGPTLLVTEAPGYVLRTCDEAFDVARFEAGVADARSLLSRGDPAGAAVVVCEALALWHGDAYAEFDDEEWARAEAQRLGELRLSATELHFEAQLACGRSRAVIPELEAMARRHPLREAFVAQLMTALYRSGRQADALRAYQEHRSVLVEELGLDPTPSLRELEDRILSHDQELLSDAGGQVLRGYRLGDRLGTGRDGTVFAAHLPGVDRELVVRAFHRDVADAPDFVRAFETSAQRLTALRHPAIIPIHDYWREPGVAYLVMRRLRGGSLSDRIARFDRHPPSRAEVAAIVQRVGGALIAASEAGVVHDRLGPDAVLFDESGDAWVGDFDLARLPGTGSSAADALALVTLVQTCLPATSAAVADAVRSGRTPGEPQPIVEVVARLVAVLADDRPVDLPPVKNPYKGLRAFDESDAGDFFGRESVITDVLGRLASDGVRGRLVLVVGGSGTGKSSAVRAGVLPLVRRGDVPGSERWFVTTMLPGAAPFKELAAALRRVAVSDRAGTTADLAVEGGIDRVVRELLPDGGQLLLVIDQLEELFTTSSEREQRRFLEGIVHAIRTPGSRLRVVGTLRADFYDRPLAVQPLGSLVLDATVTIPAMAPAELEAAIVEPARRARRAVEGALVAELVSAAVDEPAGLPSLQFTLFELAERGESDLTLASYRRLGGLTGAIASRAEALYSSLDDEERAAVRRLFEQLVIVSTDGEPTRRRAVRADVASDDPALDSLIARWADARLLTLDRHPQSRLPTVEPAHEALLREWPRLRRWLDEDRGALILLGHLREAAASWEGLDRDPGALYRGSRLQSAADALGASTLPALEREFLEAGLDARAAEELDAAARAHDQVRANHRLRRQLVVIAIALVVALIGGFVALDQREEARQERRVAFVRELAAAAEASVEEDPERAMLLALEAVDVSRRAGDVVRPEALEALHRGVSRSRILLSVPGLGGALDWSPDGSVFVTEGPEETGLVDLRDAETGESVYAFVGHDIDINDVAFAPDGAAYATTGDDGWLRIWDTETGDQLAELGGGGAQRVVAPAFSPDGRHVAAHWANEPATRVFDRRSGDLVSEVEGWVEGIGFSADGARLAIASNNERAVLLVDVATGDELLRIGEDVEPARNVRFSPDGRWLASVHLDGVVRVWDARTGELRFEGAHHASAANDLDWSADSSRLVTAGDDGFARVFELRPGGLRELVAASARDTGNGIGAVAFSPDGDRIMTGDHRLAAVKVWDVSERAGGELANVVSTAGSRGSGSFLPDGDTIVAQEPDGHAALWDADTGRRRLRIDLRLGSDVDPREGVTLSPSPDGTLLATTTGFTARIFDLGSGALVATLADPTQDYSERAVWSPDSQHLALLGGWWEADDDNGGAVAVYDRTGEPLASIVEERFTYISSAAFVGDGERLVVAMEQPRPAPGQIGLRVWDWEAGEVIDEYTALPRALAADPTGTRIVVAGLLAGDADLYDLDTGAIVRTLRSPGVVNGVAWSADGEQVATAGADGTVRVWDADSGRLQTVLRGHERAVAEAHFSPDGRRMASLDESGIVRVWTLDVDELIDLARSRLTRDLHDDECLQYLRRPTCAET